jgi:hypothetical protein
VDQASGAEQAGELDDSRREDPEAPILLAFVVEPIQAIMIKSKFDPRVHGLPYKNGSFKFKVGPANVSVLCGGLSYAALDYFYTGIKVPESKKIPVEGNPMETYLYRRQVTAHFYTWHRFANAWSVSQIPGISSLVGEQDDINLLARHLSERPVILCLYGGPTTGHHVVASACDPAANLIQLYDSNHPGVVSTIQLKNGDWVHDQSNYGWTGWFMDWGHYSHGTIQPPLAYRYCRRCHGLNTRSLGVYGQCGGGGHDNNLDLEYFLPWDPGDGQGGWKVCGQCQGLFRQGSDAPLCPAGGLHYPQGQNANWKECYVATEGAGEANWRRCNDCTSLFWMKPDGDTGTCAGGKHSPANSDKYVADCRTI